MPPGAEQYGGSSAMKNSRAFSPSVSEQLESRVALSTVGGTTYPPGTFHQGDLPGFFVRPQGPYTTKAMLPAATAPPAAALLTPHANVENPTPVTYPPGTFHQGSLPGIFVRPTG